MTNQLPSTDELFGPTDPKELPSTDDLFGEHANEPSSLAITGRAIGRMATPTFTQQGQVNDSQAVSDFFKKTPAGRISDAFFKGGAEPFTEGGPLGLGEEAENDLKKAGIFNDVTNGQVSLLKAFNEGVVRPAAVAGDALLRGITSPFMAAGGALRQAAEEGVPLAKPASELIYGIPEGAYIGMTPHTALPEPVARAKANRVLDGEAVYMGLKDPTPEQSSGIHEAAAMLPEEASPTTVPKAAPSVHEVANSLNPEVMGEYRSLEHRQKFFRDRLDELAEQRDRDMEANPPKADEIQALRDQEETILSKVNGVEDRLTKTASEKLEAIRAQRDALAEESGSLSKADTEDMANLRRSIQENDYRMRDLAPDVSDAYRRAHEQTKTAEDQGAAAAAAQDQEIKGLQEDLPQPTEEQQPAEEASPEKPFEQQRAAIASDVAQKQIALGRPEEEAKASGEIVARFMQTMSEMYGGKRGSAEEWYAREGAQLRAGRERAKVLAQDGKGRELNQNVETKTDTPEFKQWFGDSKVVDDEGKPLVVYHGTNQSLESFLKERMGKNTNSASSRGGFFFTEDTKEAGDYANMSARKQVSNAVESEKNAERLLKAIDRADARGDFDLVEKLTLELEQSEIGAMQEGERGANVVPVYLNIKNPMILDMKGKDLHDMQSAIKDAKRNGHDGMRLENVFDPVANRDDLKETTQWVAFKPEQIKSVNNRGTFDPKDPRILYQKETAPTFYSALERSVDDLKQPKGSPEQWQGILRNLKGVKPEEIEWSGINDWLKEQKGPVTKEQVQDYLRAHNLEVQEVVKGGEKVANLEKKWEKAADAVNKATADHLPEERITVLRNRRDALRDQIEAGQKESDQTKFSQYTLPGGQAYKELLITLPNEHTIEKLKEQYNDAFMDSGASSIDDLLSKDASVRSTAENKVAMLWNSIRTAEKQGSAEFKTSHFDEPNILAHVRFDERTDAEGKRVLHIAEVQSDFGQMTRKVREEARESLDKRWGGVLDRMKKDGILEVVCP